MVSAAASAINPAKFWQSALVNGLGNMANEFINNGVCDPTGRADVFASTLAGTLLGKSKLLATSGNGNLGSNIIDGVQIALNAGISLVTGELAGGN